MNITNPTNFGIPGLTLTTANSEGTGNAVRTGASLLAYDTTLPAAVGSAATGSAATSARRDHSHAGLVSTLTANLNLATYLLVGNGGSTGVAVSADGEVNMAAQPAFLVYNAATESNVTGAGANVSLGFDTEVFDIGSNFAETGGVGQFHAPITGKYILAARYDLQGITTSATQIVPQLITSNRDYNGEIDGWSEGEYCTSIVVVADMDADDIAYMKLQISGESSNVVDIRGTGTQYTTFSGYLAT